MNKFLSYICLAFVLVSTLSCRSSSDIDLTGEWHMVSSGGTDMDVVSVYVSFQGGDFELFQKNGEGRYRYFSGNYFVNGSHVTGTYDDGESWGSSYDVRLDQGGSVLVMTASNGSGEVSSYDRTTIPAEVRTEAVPGVRSANEDDFEPIL